MAERGREEIHTGTRGKPRQANKKPRLAAAAKTTQEKKEGGGIFFFFFLYLLLLSASVPTPTRKRFHRSLHFKRRRRMGQMKRREGWAKKRRRWRVRGTGRGAKVICDRSRLAEVEGERAVVVPPRRGREIGVGRRRRRWAKKEEEERGIFCPKMGSPPPLSPPLLLSSRLS